jgi:hypothetical protein
MMRYDGVNHQRGGFTCSRPSARYLALARLHNPALHLCVADLASCDPSTRSSRRSSQSLWRRPRQTSRMPSLPSPPSPPPPPPPPPQLLLLHLLLLVQAASPPPRPRPRAPVDRRPRPRPRSRVAPLRRRPRPLRPLQSSPRCVCVHKRAGRWVGGWVNGWVGEWVGFAMSIWHCDPRHG